MRRGVCSRRRTRWTVKAVLAGAVAMVATGLMPKLSRADQTFNGATLNADVTLQTGETGTVLNGLTLLNGHKLSHQYVLNFNGNQTVSGNGEIVSDLPGGQAYIELSGDLTVGAGITLRTGSGGFSVYSSFNRVISNGTISSQTLGSAINFSLQNGLTNNGVIKVLQGSGLALPPMLVNNGTITNSGSIALYGTMTPATLGNYTSTSDSTTAMNGVMDLNGGSLSLSGNWIMGSSGSVFQNGTIQSGPGGLLFAGGNLKNVTLAVDSVVSGRVDVEGTLTLANSVVRMGEPTSSGNAPMRFGTASGAGPTTLNGTGEVLFVRPGQTPNYLGGLSLTIGSGITMRTTTGDASVDFLLNQGLIRSDGAGRLVTITGPTSSGTIQGTNGGSVWVKNLHNSGAVSIAGGGSLTLEGSWTNSGSISATDSTVVLTGSGSLSHTQVNIISRSNSPVVLKQAFDNTGTTLLVDSAQGTWRLGGGARIVGGTVGTTGAAKLELLNEGSPAAPTLDGVTLDVDVVPVTPLLGSLAVTNGLTLNGVKIGAGYLSFTGTQTLGGTGTISAGDGQMGVRSGMLTIGPGIWIDHQVGFAIGADPTAAIINYGTLTGRFLGLTANNGTILVGPGKEIQECYLKTGNAGLVSVAGGTIQLQGTGYINSGTAAVSDGGWLKLIGTWANTGTMSVTDATLELGGTFTTGGIGRVLRNGGTVLLGGKLDNTGTVLALSAQTGDWQIINAGRITGGTITSADGATLFVGDGASIFDATLQAPLTLHTPITFTTFSAVRIVNQSTITKSGAYANGEFNSTDLNNQGTIAISGGKFRLGGNWSNSGTILLNGGTLEVNGPKNNSGSILLNGGTLYLANYSGSSTGTISGSGNVMTTGTWVAADLPPMNRTGGTFFFGGTFNNTGSTFTIDSVGSWTVAAGGRISGGTLSGTGDPKLFIQRSTSSSGTLSGLNLGVDVQVLTGASLRIAGGLNGIGDRTIWIGEGVGTSSTTSLNFVGTQNVTGAGEIVFNSLQSPSTARAQAYVSGGTVTLGPAITLRSGTSGGTFFASGATIGLIGQGTISSQTIGQGVAIVGNFTNSGLVEARNSATLSLNSATLSNLSGNTLTGGRWAVFSNSTMTMGSSTITTNNADILLDGPNSTFAPINPLLVNMGSFKIDHDRDFITVGSLTNSGFLGVGTNSTLYVSGPLNNTGSIDLVGTLIVNYDPGPGESSTFDELVGQIGTAIFSSLLDRAHGIGSADNVELMYTSFGGLPVDPSSVLMMLTFAGDANLDGMTDLEDFDRFLVGYGPGEAAPVWIYGDFDYSGAVNLNDFEAYLHGYYAMGGSAEAISSAVDSAPLSESDRLAMHGLIATVPEPVLVGGVGLLIPVLLGRSRRRR